MATAGIAARVVHAIKWRADLFLRLVLAKFAELLTLLRWHLQKPGKKHTLKSPLVVSLTSYPPRYPRLALTLKCLLRQSVSPDRVILWVSYADMKALPRDVLALVAHGLEIRLSEDLKSFKKIIPLLQEQTDVFICTADDDLYYRSNWLQELVAETTEGVICCHRAHEIAVSSDGSFRHYHEWTSDTPRRETSKLFFPTGAGGVLYPPQSLDAEVLNVTAFKRLCPKGDDIWLYWMGRKAGSTYRTVGKRRDLITWSGTQDVALHLENLAQGNDEQIKQVAAVYGYPSL